MTNQWQTLSSEYVHQNNWYRVRQDKVIMPNGKEGQYNVIESLGSVFIIALNGQNQILLIKLFRYPSQKYFWEIPGGAIDEGESPIEAAKRELQEETGFIANQWIDLGYSEMTNGKSAAKSWFFVAKGLAQTNKHEQEAEGIANVKFTSHADLLASIKSGQITDGPTLVAITKLSANSLEL